MHRGGGVGGGGLFVHMAQGGKGAVTPCQHAMADGTLLYISVSSVVHHMTVRCQCVTRTTGAVSLCHACPHSLKLKYLVLLPMHTGRRSTDLLHLLLQNLYFMHYCQGYVATSSIFAVVIIHQLSVELGMSTVERHRVIGRLGGTHAHEMTSMMQQLMVQYDINAGQACGLKVCFSTGTIVVTPLQ